MKSKYAGKFKKGQKFGKRTIISSKIYEIKYKNAPKHSTAGIKVKCECGEIKIVVAKKLLNGNSFACKHCVHGSFDNNPNWKGVGRIPGRYFGNLKRNAIRRKLEFKLTIEYLSKLFEKQNRKCALTGDNIYFSEARKYKMETSASLDRIDNNKGYINGNVQFVSKKVNFAKHKTSEEDFINMCRKVVKLYGVK
jgi:hypothetical protein